MTSRLHQSLNRLGDHLMIYIEHLQKDEDWSATQSFRARVEIEMPRHVQNKNYVT